MAEKGPIRVFIADDFDLLRQVMHKLLEDAEDIEVVGEAPHLEEAMAETKTLQPDVIIMNDYLPPIDSAYASRLFRELGISGAILIVSMHAEPDLIKQSLNNGANGFMRKDEMGELLVEAIRRVHEGRQYLSPEAERALSNARD